MVRRTGACDATSWSAVAPLSKGHRRTPRCGHCPGCRMQTTAIHYSLLIGAAGCRLRMLSALFERRAATPSCGQSVRPQPMFLDPASSAGEVITEQAPTSPITVSRLGCSTTRAASFPSPRTSPPPSGHSWSVSGTNVYLLHRCVPRSTFRTHRCAQGTAHSPHARSPALHKIHRQSLGPLTAAHGRSSKDPSIVSARSSPRARPYGNPCIPGRRISYRVPDARDSATRSVPSSGPGRSVRTFGSFIHARGTVLTR